MESTGRWQELQHVDQDIGCHEMWQELFHGCLSKVLFRRARRDIRANDHPGADGHGRRTPWRRFWTVRMVLEQAVVDGRLAKSPAEYIKLPTETGTNGGQVGVVVDRASSSPLHRFRARSRDPFALQRLGPRRGVGGVASGGTRRAHHRQRRTAGPAVEPNAPAKPGVLRVEQAARAKGAAIEYGPLKTKQSYRRVPLTAETTELLRDYLAAHPRRVSLTPRCSPVRR
ncbi:site-specific integrase [Mycolicibacterium litorale]|nr:hypothetical protein [Mycolicibacterium litorale]MCV7416902.1 hypothetical protein [Mycolicibacterium litorale]